MSYKEIIVNFLLDSFSFFQMSRPILTLYTDDTSLPLLYMDRSPLPSAGTEDVFQGCGEGNNTPPPSPPPSPDLDTHLQAVFSSCDPTITGLVHAGKLVEYLTSLVDQEDMEGWKVEELHRMLDPTGDNKHVDLPLFLRVGRDWVERVATQEKKQQVEKEVEEESSTEEEKMCEDRYLRQQLTRMRDEYSELLRMNEEQVTKLTKELDHSKEKVVSLEKDLEKYCDMLEEMDAIKQRYEKLMKVNECLKAKEDKIAEENDHLKSELEEEKCHVVKAQAVVKELNENVINAQSALAVKELEMKEILSEMEEIKRNLKIELSKNEDLECNLSHVREKLSLSEFAETTSKDKVDDELSQVSSKVEVDEDFIIDDDISMQPSLEFSSNADALSSQGENIDQGTIMEEIQEAVYMDSLLSPINRKHLEYVAAETEVKKRKERLVEVVKTKVGIENDIWLESLEKEIEDCFNSVLAVNTVYDLQNDSVIRISLIEKFKEKFSWIIFIFIILLICFTFFGGFEVDYQIYYPITWHLLRLLVGDSLPGPALLFRYNTMPMILVQ